MKIHLCVWVEGWVCVFFCRIKTFMHADHTEGSRLTTGSCVYDQQPEANVIKIHLIKTLDLQRRPLVSQQHPSAD